MDNDWSDRAQPNKTFLYVIKNDFVRLCYGYKQLTARHIMQKDCSWLRRVKAQSLTYPESAMTFWNLSNHWKYWQIKYKIELKNFLK